MPDVMRVQVWGWGFVDAYLVREDDGFTTVASSTRRRARWAAVARAAHALESR